MAIGWATDQGSWQLGCTHAYDTNARLLTGIWGVSLLLFTRDVHLYVQTRAPTLPPSAEREPAHLF